MSSGVSPENRGTWLKRRKSAGAIPVRKVKASRSRSESPIAHTPHFLHDLHGKFLPSTQSFALNTEYSIKAANYDPLVQANATPQPELRGINARHTLSQTM